MLKLLYFSPAENGNLLELNLGWNHIRKLAALSIAKGIWVIFHFICDFFEPIWVTLDFVKRIIKVGNPCWDKKRKTIQQSAVAVSDAVNLYHAAVVLYSLVLNFPST